MLVSLITHWRLLNLIKYRTLFDVIDSIYKQLLWIDGKVPLLGLIKIFDKQCYFHLFIGPYKNKLFSSLVLNHENHIISKNTYVYNCIKKLDKGIRWLCWDTHSNISNHQSKNYSNAFYQCCVVILLDAREK